jgi:tetratricopeptide (TPR) repeat protein
MITWKNISQTFALLFSWIFLSTFAEAQVTARLSSTFIARGEKALLEVIVSDSPADDIPEIPLIDKATIQVEGYSADRRFLPSGRGEYVYRYVLFSYEVGKYAIPPIEVSVRGVKNITAPVEFVVFNSDELEWSTDETGERPFRYASSFRILNKKPFENETIPIEIKVYVPAELLVLDWGIPSFERDGLTAWRFQPTPDLSRVNLLGRPYTAVAYPSTLTPTRTGAVSIGPAKVRLMVQEVVMNPLPERKNTPIFLEIPKLDLEAKPLPEGAPEGFENAVGNFIFTARSAVTEVQEGDPITVDLYVTGTGNLDIMKPPALVNDDGWKTYGTTSEQRGEERRQLYGNMLFHQSIRPLELKNEIPPFRLVYFDPKDETYKTIISQPIPLQMTASTAPVRSSNAAVKSAPVPLERMTDILNILRPAQLTMPATSSLPSWLGHLLASIVALGLIAKALWMRYGYRFRKDPKLMIRLRELREIESSKSNSDIDFLKSAGNFIERWLADKPSTEVQAILAERDAVCFRSEKPTSLLDQRRRSEILKILRNAMMAVVMVFAFGSSQSSHAADLSTLANDAFDAAKYDEAISHWLSAGDYDELSADTLYNIGNACYRAGSPGHAALYYRRAMLRDTSHQESQQNLRFIERKYGAISVPRPDYQYALTQLSLATWKSIFWAAAWLCVLALLVFPATRNGARLRMVSATTLVFAPLLAFIAFIGWFYYPNDSKFAPVAQQAVIIQDKAVLHVDASRTSPEVIDAPPGSLCEVIHQTGGWSYIAFATKTRGWIPTESIEKLIPKNLPTPPKFRKPKADGKTA